MRTTLNIDDDVLERARDIAAKQSKAFRVVVNEALREGLKRLDNPVQHRPFKTKAVAMGMRQELNIDNVQELLAQTEGEDFS